ncbi:hypothetical protein EI42_04165 [Thermosporothrix hazakensis]|jgi:hypothetical protein|uniref:Uncharacterized protein n=1 Tax=Thermosporothrix hazakensis TaxID=644383 RepID=A0A326U2J8_THEHA|nr:hypothetical protein EI42_04165 [Thermosporothrix hazakensis]GCE48167.1 hypothetical protein KTH_30360 [Thermosporothrix hazakensis]
MMEALNALSACRRRGARLLHEPRYASSRASLLKQIHCITLSVEKYRTLRGKKAMEEKKGQT